MGRHPVAVKVPVYVVLLLIIAEVAILWWQGTRRYDFLTPPGQAELAAVEVEAARTFAPPAARVEPVIEEPDREETLPDEEHAVEPEFDVGDIATVPGLDAYAVESPKGAAYLAKLATALEQRGAFDRALLAWERVIDLGNADAGQYSHALGSIKRLRPIAPPWNVDSETTIPVVIHVGAGSETANLLKPVLDGISEDMHTFSSGILRVTHELTVGRRASNAPPKASVALWLAGGAKNAVATPALSFTLQEQENIRDQLMGNIYELMRSFLKEKTAYAPLGARPLDEPSADSLAFRVSRLCWREFGAILNAAPAPSTAPSRQSGQGR